MEQFLPATWRAYILHHYKTCLFLWKLFSRRMTDCLSAGIDNTLPKLASGASFLSSIWPDAIQQYFNDLSMDCTGPSAHQCTCSIFKHQYAKGLTILAILHGRQFWFTFICSSQITFSNMSCIKGICLTTSSSCLTCFSSCQFQSKKDLSSHMQSHLMTLNPPAPKVLGRDLPDGTRKRLQVYLGGGGPIFRPKPPVFDRSWRSPSKNTVKNSTEDTCSWTRPSKIGKRKVKKKPCFSTFWPQFFGLQHLFLRFRRWPGPEADFWVFGPVFGLIFVVLW